MISRVSRPTRRRFVLGATALVSVPYSGIAQTSNCGNISAAQALVASQIQGIGVWVTIDGPTLVANARAKIIELKENLPSAHQQLNGAARQELIALLSGLLGGSLVIVGVVAMPAASVMMVSGLALSSGLLIAEALFSPQTLNPVAAATLNTATAANAALEALSEGGTVTARNIGKWGSQIVGAATFIYDVMCYINALQESSVAESRLSALMVEITRLESALSHASTGAGLREIRHDALTGLQQELGALGCLRLPPPG